MVLMWTHAWFEMANTFLFDGIAFAIGAVLWIVSWVFLGFTSLLAVALVLAILGSLILGVVKLLSPSTSDEISPDQDAQ